MFCSLTATTVELSPSVTVSIICSIDVCPVSLATSLSGPKTNVKYRKNEHWNRRLHIISCNRNLNLGENGFQFRLKYKTKNIKTSANEVKPREWKIERNTPQNSGWIWMIELSYIWLRLWVNVCVRSFANIFISIDCFALDWLLPHQQFKFKYFGEKYNFLGKTPIYCWKWSILFSAVTVCQSSCCSNATHSKIGRSGCAEKQSVEKVV